MRQNADTSVKPAVPSPAAQLAAVLDASQDAVIFLDSNSLVSSWSRSAERMFGYRAEEMIGLPIRRIIPEDRQHEADSIQAQLHHRRSVQQFQTLRQTRDGNLIAVSVTIAPLSDAEGQVVGALKMAREVTSEHHHERELERMVRLYDALSQVNQAIVWTADRATLFNKICRVLVERGGLRMAWIGWKDPHSDRLLPAAVFGDETGFLQHADVWVDERPEGRGPSAVSFRSGQPVVCHDLQGHAGAAVWHAAAAAAGFHASASMPLRLGGKVAGVLSVYVDRPGFFRDREVSLLLEAAGDVSFALDNLAREEARRLAEQTLREETLFSQSMLDSMPGVVYFYDLGGRFLRWNRNFEIATGRSAEEILTMHPLDFFKESDRAVVDQRIAEVFATGEASVEAHLGARDGSSRPYLFTGRQFHFAGRPCLVGVGIDISARRRAEAALRESRAHLLEAQRIAGIGSWSLDLRTGALTWSDQIYRIFGVDRAEFDGGYEGFIGFVHPDDRPALRAAQQAALTGQAPLDIEHRILLRDGSEKVVHELAALKRDADGQPVTLEGTVHDITARVRLQAERERRHRAEAADRMKSAFLATMSHELRTPLNSILGFSGILLRGLAGPFNLEQSKQLGMVQTSARHLLALVNDVLDLSKIEAGQLVVARHPYDPRRSLEQVVGLVAAQAAAKGLNLRLNVAADLGQPIGDARRFEQVLLNLLSNAIKFTDCGEVTVTARTVPEAGGFEVCVADTGIGIRPQDHDLLFEPFRQVDSGLARHHEGTGLGLAICHRVLSLMGGGIAVESEFGRGSRFTVTLPFHPPGCP